VNRLTADDEELAGRELESGLDQVGATPVTRCRRGEPVCVAGTLRAVTLRPRAGVPTLEAELYDGTGTITLIWLGRRRIGGIDCGRSMAARGRLTAQPDGPGRFRFDVLLRGAAQAETPFFQD